MLLTLPPKAVMAPLMSTSALATGDPNTACKSAAEEGFIKPALVLIENYLNYLHHLPRSFHLMQFPSRSGLVFERYPAPKKRVGAYSSVSVLVKEWELVLNHQM